MASDLTGLLDDLYSALLTDFIQRRSEAVKALKAEGRKEEAARVKSLKKPSTAAWVVNQLYFRRGAQLEELTLANEAVRQAHGRAGESLPKVMNHRRESFDRLMTEARDILAGAGFSPTREQLRRIHRTLEAATTRGAKDGPGRLVRDLEPTGFGALAGLSIVPPEAERTSRKAKPSPGDSVRTKAAPETTGKKAPRPKREIRSAHEALEAKSTGASATKKVPRGNKASEAVGTSERAKAQASAAIKIEQAKLERAEREVTRAEAAYLAAQRHIRRSEAKISRLEERIQTAHNVLTEAKSEATQKELEFSEAKESLVRAKSRVREAGRVPTQM